MEDFDPNRERRRSAFGASTPAILNLLRTHSVEAVYYAAAYPQRDTFEVWLEVATDERRDSLCGSHPFLAEVKAVMKQAGFTQSEVAGVTTHVESRETIDRDFDGNWGYRLR